MRVYRGGGLSSGRGLLVRALLCYRMAYVRLEKVFDSCIVTFTLRKTFDLPAIYLSDGIGVDALEEMLVLGAQTYEKRESWIRRLGTEEVEGTVIADLRKGAEEKVAKAAAEVEMLRRRLAEAVDSGRVDVEKVRRDCEAVGAAEIDVLRRRIADAVDAGRVDVEKVRRECEAVGAGRIAGLEARVASLSGQVNGLEDARRLVEKEVRDRVCAERDEMWSRVSAAEALRVGDLERMLCAVEGRRRELEEKLSARVAAAALVGASSALRGAAGEADFGELLAGAGLVAESTGKQSHMCDYRGIVGGMDVFYEVKNHLSVLKEAEVTKFLRDMKEHPEVGVGVFCALQLGLPGARRAGTLGGGIVVEWLEDRRMVIYVGELLCGGFDTAVETMKVVRKFVEAGVRVRRMLLDAESDDSGEAARLIDRIARAKGYMESVGERVRGLFNKMRIDQKTVAAIHDSSLAAVKMMREEVKMCIGALLGEELFDAEDGVVGEQESKDGWVEAEVSPKPMDISESVVFIQEPVAATKPPRKRGVKKAITPTCE